MSYRVEEIKPYNGSEKKSEQVKQMFDHIAPGYDKMNRTLSLSIDRRWRIKAIKSLIPYRPQYVLDVATGTGDFAMLAAHIWQPKQITGIDISDGMMQIARRKAAEQKMTETVRFEQGDVTALPYPDTQFDAVTVAFGIRNFEQLDKGLQEMCRVLKPEGHLLILELSSPRRFLLKQLFSLYLNVVFPVVGHLLTNDVKAYRYLNKSVSAFPQGEEMQEILLKAGFECVTFQRLTMGICTLYIAKK